jgi:rhodanese-related sulfurtransferase
MGLGAWFHNSVDDVIAWFETLGSTALMVVGFLLALFVLFKYIERKRNLGGANLPRITMVELKDLLEAGHDPLIVDARGVTARQLEAGIPGALVYGDNVPERLMATLDKDRHIVIYCSCPNDVTAAQVAKEFVKNGFHRARPLHGGLDAWNDHCAAAQSDAELKPKHG